MCLFPRIPRTCLNVFFMLPIFFFISVGHKYFIFIWPEKKCKKVFRLKPTDRLASLDIMRAQLRAPP